MDELEAWPWRYRVRRQLPERFGEPCRVLVQGRGRANRNRLLEFLDGFRVVVPFWSVRRRRRAS